MLFSLVNSISHPAILEPLDQDIRALFCIAILGYLFAISSAWTQYFNVASEGNATLHWVLNILFTMILTAIVQMGSGHLVRKLAISDHPLLVKPFGRFLPVGSILVGAMLLDIVIVLWLFGGDSCGMIINRRIYPFVGNIIAHYIMPGIPVEFVKYVIFKTIGKQIDYRQALDELFQQKEHILELQLASTSAQEPLLT